MVSAILSLIGIVLKIWFARKTKMDRPRERMEKVGRESYELRQKIRRALASGNRDAYLYYSGLAHDRLQAALSNPAAR